MSEHVKGADCWCRPRLTQSCPECEPGAAEGCWRCDGDGVVDEYNPDLPLIIIHNSIDEILETVG